MDITGYIPIHPSHERNMVAKGGFDYRGDHPVRPECKTLRRVGFHRRDRVYQYVTRQRDCQQCPIEAECLPPRQKRRYVSLSMYHPLFLSAKERHHSKTYQMKMRR